MPKFYDLLWKSENVIDRTAVLTFARILAVLLREGKMDWLVTTKYSGIGLRLSCVISEKQLIIQVEFKSWYPR